MATVGGQRTSRSRRPQRRSADADHRNRSARLCRLDELVVLANAPVGGEEQELHADRDDPAVLPRGHVPHEADGAVVVVGTARAKDTAAVAHPLLVGGAHARFERLVPADVEGRGEVGAVGGPDLFDQPATRRGIGLVPLGHVTLEEPIEVGARDGHGSLLAASRTEVHYLRGNGNTAPACYRRDHAAIQPVARDATPRLAPAPPAHPGTPRARVRDLTAAPLLRRDRARPAEPPAGPPSL